MILSLYSTQDLTTMARHLVAYDHSRLVTIAEKATKSTKLKGVDVACKYVQEEDEVSSQSKVTFEWSATTPEYQWVETENEWIRIDNTPRTCAFVPADAESGTTFPQSVLLLDYRRTEMREDVDAEGEVTSSQSALSQLTPERVVEDRRRTEGHTRLGNVKWAGLTRF